MSLNTPGAEHTHRDNPQVSITGSSCARCQPMDYPEFTGASLSLMSHHTRMLRNVLAHLESGTVTKFDREDIASIISENTALLLRVPESLRSLIIF